MNAGQRSILLYGASCPRKLQKWRLWGNRESIPRCDPASSLLKLDVGSSILLRPLPCHHLGETQEFRSRPVSRNGGLDASNRRSPFRAGDLVRAKCLKEVPVALTSCQHAVRGMRGMRVSCASHS